MLETKFQTYTKLKDKITILYILIFTFLDSRWENKRSEL
jgi:hypothetical protein